MVYLSYDECGFSIHPAVGSGSPAGGRATVGAETHAKLRRAQDLLRHSVPNGDAAVIFDRALTLLLADLTKTKVAATDRPARASRPTATGSRHIPATVRRAVWARDEGRCAFVGTVGRCTELGFLEFHHVVPFAAGGQATVDNIQLRCRRHNAHEAEQFFGSGSLFVRESAGFGYETQLGPDRVGWMVSAGGSVAESVNPVATRTADSSICYGR